MAMDEYDPMVAPDPEIWLALDEAERIRLIEAYRVANDIELPNVKLHATMNTIVETQIAMGDELPVREKARQLMAQGLTRHDAIHAIGSVLLDFIMDVRTGKVTGPDPNQRYYRALQRLTARSWLRSG
jgi:hypothetical protein